MERLDEYELCFGGFRSRTAPTITVTSPTGVVRRIAASRVNGSWRWRVYAGVREAQLPELGRHTFSVSGIAGSRPATTSGVIVVVPAPSPRGSFTGDFANGFAVRGGRIVVEVAGFPAGSTVYVTVFGPRPNGYAVTEDLPDLVTNEWGEGYAQWNIPSGSAGGHYGVWVDPYSTVDSMCVREGGLCFTFELE